MNEARNLKDKNGIRLVDAIKEHGIDFEKVKDSGKELKNAGAYIELHIEQGPVLLDLDLPLGTVLGTFGVERHAITFHGQAAHSGSTPMNRRRDAFLAAARMSPEIYKIAERSNGGVCTIGSCITKPGIVTSVVEECRITLDHSSVPPPRDQEGGLSGRLLRDKATALVREIKARSNIPVIALGGICDAASAREKMEAGAQLLQIYTGYVYRGPGLLREISAGSS
jgi:acetylornithine deacetylase/succinyl-diaminopimelate desuccinylase-like protein